MKIFKYLTSIVLTASLLIEGGAIAAVTVLPGSQQTWTMSGAPDSTVVLGQGGIIYVGDTFIDTNTGKTYQITTIGEFDIDTQTYIDCAFKEYIFDANIGSFITNNQPRSWQPVSLAVNTARTPSATKDVSVKITATLNSTVLVPATISLQIRTSTSPDVWSTLDPQGLSALLTGNPTSCSIIVPANSTYRYTTSGSVTNIQVFELPN